jgi:GT2 family glycosyltransferase
VYVVLVNFNGWADTIECLESVLRSDYPNTRVVVVDNGSADGSLEKLMEWADGTRPPPSPRNPSLSHLTSPPVTKPIEYVCIPARRGTHRLRDAVWPPVTFIACPENLGFAGGNNVALRLLLEAHSDGYACLINNDMVAAPAAVRALVDAIESDPKLGAVGGLILDYYQTDEVQAVGGGRMSRLSGMTDMYGAGWRRDQVRAPEALGYVSGGWLLSRSDTLRDVGLMDETYFLYAEDADWGERMRNRGYRLGCAVDALAWHKGSQTTVAGSPLQDYYLVRSSLMFVRKHAPQFTPFAAAYLMVRCFFPKIVRRQWGRARSVMKAYADYARGK